MQDHIQKLRAHFSEDTFTVEDYKVFAEEAGIGSSLDALIDEGWVEEEDAGGYVLSNSALEYAPKSAGVVEDTLSLGELEEHIVGALEKGKEVPWGKLAVAMWAFFIFMILYTLAQAYFV